MLWKSQTFLKGQMAMKNATKTQVPTMRWCGKILRSMVYGSAIKKYQRSNTAVPQYRATVPVTASAHPRIWNEYPEATRPELLLASAGFSRSNRVTVSWNDFFLPSLSLSLSFIARALRWPCSMLTFFFSWRCRKHFKCFKLIKYKPRVTSYSKHMLEMSEFWGFAIFWES